MGKCSMFLLKKTLTFFVGIILIASNCFDFEALLNSLWTGTYYLDQTILKFTAIYLQFLHHARIRGMYKLNKTIIHSYYMNFCKSEIELKKEKVNDCDFS